MDTIRIFRHHIPKPMLWLGAMEFGLLNAAGWAGTYLRLYDVPASFLEVQPIAPKAIALATVLILSMAALGLYERQPNLGRKGILIRIGAAFVFSLVPLSLVFYIFPALYLGRGAVAFALGIGLLLCVLVRTVFYRFVRHKVLRWRVLVLGTGAVAKEIFRYVRDTRRRDFSVWAYVRLPSEVGPPTVADRVVELKAGLKELTNSADIDEIVLAADERRNTFPIDELLDCKMSGVEVSDAMTFFERETAEVRLAHLTPAWFIFSDGFRGGLLRSIIKRLLDLGVSLLALPVALPAALLVALAIKLEDGLGAPVLYSQERVGLNGKPFRIYKFRSMIEDAEAVGSVKWATEDDPRITRVGKAIRKVRLDELPQLFNVLWGHMSFVGPRPERPEFVTELAERIPYYNERHRVKSGLTGWAQISYQYGDSEEDAYRKLQYDLYYVKNQSLFLDLVIVIQTVEVILLGKGAH